MDDRIDDRFDIEGLAGTGGMGTVYRARDRVTGAIVALKILDDLAGAEAGRFVREAEILASLEHPAIVRYVSHGVHGGRPFLVMEWLEGEDLDVRLSRGRLSVEESLQLGIRVAEALHVAHDKGVVHRDVKPSNLFLPGGAIGEVKLLDFGIARRSRAAEIATRPGFIVGTPGYMAPEQARGAADITPAADVFALGCVLWECLAGRPVFWAERPVAILVKILLEPAPRVRELAPDVPPELEDLLDRLLAKDPSERPQHARVLATELARLSRGPAPAAPRRVERAIEPPTGLGSGEQGLVCVILTSPPVDPRADTVVQSLALDTSPGSVDVEDLDTARGTDLSAIAYAHGGSPVVLVDGSLAVTLRRPGAATDLAAQAARCALAMRAASAGQAIALATGRAVLGGRVPVGEAIDRAAALARAPGPPAVRIDEVTRGLLDARFEIHHDAGGFELRALREGEDHARRLLGRPIGCIGRDRELAWLRAAFERCCAEPHARPVLLVGPPGIGKSRLRHELVAEARRRGPVEVWLAAGDPLAAGSPFGLIAQMLRRAAGLRVGEPPEARWEKLRARVARHRPVGTEAARYLGEIAGSALDDRGHVALRAARSDPMLMGERIRTAWQELVAAESAAQPLILVLEDLHWGDVPSVRLVDAALASARDRPLFVLALARPEVHETFPALWGERGLQELPIGELSRSSAGLLVREALGPSVDDAVIAPIVERAAGNAFFLEELVRAASEGRGHEPPETVLAMLTSRIGELSADTRRVLRAASVFGQSFWREGVCTLLGASVDADAIDRILQELAVREIVVPRSDSTFEHARELHFRHALLREAAYATLTVEDRALGHRLAGEWLSGQGESDSMAVALHFERGGVPERAIDAILRGALQALEGNDLGAVLARTAHGLSLPGVREVQRAALRRLEARALLWRGERDDACRSAREAMALATRGSPVWFASAAILGVASADLGDPDTTAWVCAEITAAVEGPSEPAIMALADLSLALLAAGHYELRDRVASDLGRLSSDGFDPLVTSRLHKALAVAKWAGQELEAAVDDADLAARAARGAGDEREALLCDLCGGAVWAEIGDFIRATRVLEDVEVQARAAGLPHLVGLAHLNLSAIGYETGAVAAAESRAREALVCFQATGNLRLEAGSRLALGPVLLSQGRVEEAEHELRLALEAVGEIPHSRCRVLGRLAGVLVACSRVDEAQSVSRQAVAILTRLGTMDIGESQVRLVYVQSLLAAGRHEEARAAASWARERLLARADRFHGADRRALFLARATDNAPTLALARELLGG